MASGHKYLKRKSEKQSLYGHDKRQKLKEDEQGRRFWSPFKGNNLFSKLKALCYGFHLRNSEEICSIVCKIIFTVPVTPIDDVIESFRLCRSISFIKGRKAGLYQDLLKDFVKHLYDRFTYKKRLQNLLKNRQIAEEKKEKWLLYQCGQQEQRMKDTDPRSLMFLDMWFESDPMFVYLVLEALLQLSDCGMAMYEYVNVLLNKISMHRPKYLMETEELSTLFRNICKLAEESSEVPPSTTQLLIQHRDKHLKKIEVPVLSVADQE